MSPNSASNALTVGSTPLHADDTRGRGDCDGGNDAANPGSHNALGPSPKLMRVPSH